jgi:hypothetical protein
MDDKRPSIRVFVAIDTERSRAATLGKRHVCFMALDARDVLTGDLVGPYNDDDADRFARLALESDACPLSGAGRALRSRADCAPDAPADRPAARSSSGVSCRLPLIAFAVITAVRSRERLISDTVLGAR